MKHGETFLPTHTRVGLLPIAILPPDQPQKSSGPEFCCSSCCDVLRAFFWWQSIHDFNDFYCWLVVLTCFNHLEKYESQWEGLSHILLKNKKCFKAPTSFYCKFQDPRIRNSDVQVCPSCQCVIKLAIMSMVQIFLHGHRSCHWCRHIFVFSADCSAESWALKTKLQSHGQSPCTANSCHDTGYAHSWGQFRPFWTSNQHLSHMKPAGPASGASIAVFKPCIYIYIQHIWVRFNHLMDGANTFIYINSKIGKFHQKPP